MKLLNVDILLFRTIITLKFFAMHESTPLFDLCIVTYLAAKVIPQTSCRTNFDG